MYVEHCERVGDVAAHDDEIALGEVLDIHHAPYEGETIGGHGEDGADENPIQDQLEVQDRRLEQHQQIVQHRLLPPEKMRPRPKAGAMDCASGLV